MQRNLIVIQDYFNQRFNLLSKKYVEKSTVRDKCRITVL